MRTTTDSKRERHIARMLMPIAMVTIMVLSVTTVVVSAAPLSRRVSAGQTAATAAGMYREGPSPAYLSISTSNPTPLMFEQFSIFGQLKSTPTGAGQGYREIYLQRWYNSTHQWGNLQNMSNKNITVQGNSAGYYSFKMHFDYRGDYYLRTVFKGDSAWGRTESEQVYVKVAEHRLTLETSNYQPGTQSFTMYGYLKHINLLTGHVAGMSDGDIRLEQWNGKYWESAAYYGNVTDVNGYDSFKDFRLPSSSPAHLRTVLYISGWPDDETHSNELDLNIGGWID